MMKMKMFVILALVSQHALGVEVYEGEESVLLPCHFAAPIPTNYTVVWRRERDLNAAIVHTIVEGKDDVINQNNRYTNRTSMRALQSVDLSLTLRKPTVSDSGNYTCVTRSHGVDQQKTEVLLKVTGHPPWLKVLTDNLGTISVLCAGLVTIFSGVVAAVLYFLKVREKNITVSQLTPVEVTEGAPSVLLLYKPSFLLPESFRMEWIFVTDENKKVYVFENGQIKHDQQHTDYRERTAMESYPPKEKKETDQLNQSEVDLSLTLKNPVCADGGVYLCFIYDKHGRPVTLKVVTLLVTETLRASVKKKNRMASRRRSTVVLSQQKKNAEGAHPLTS